MSSGESKSPFGAYDIRGVYGENLTEDFARRLGVALTRYITAPDRGYAASRSAQGSRAQQSAYMGKRFAIGHDARTSSPGLAQALADGIASGGGDVTMIGVSSTPAVCWYGATHGFDCLVAVTASHLAAKYNGFKICRAGAEAICSENGLLEIEALMSEIKAEGVAPPKSLTGKLTDVTDALELYIAAMERFLNVASPLRIVVDAGGSPVGRELARLFQNTEVEVVPLGFELDGGFSRRSANPLDEGALDELSARVVREGARFGAAFDGDADRVVFVDEGGKMIPPDLIIALLAQEMLLKSPGASIMYDLRSSRAVPEAITASGGNPIKCRVGTFIGADMRKQGAVLAGELSAHYYWSELFCADNALKALIELTSLISHVAEPLSQVVKPLMKYVSSGEINFKCTQSKLIIERLAARYEAERIDRLDGLTVEFDDWWFNVRPSQTEPLVRLCLGAADAELLAQRKNDLQKSIEELSGVSA